MKIRRLLPAAAMVSAITAGALFGTAPAASASPPDACGGGGGHSYAWCQYSNGLDTVMLRVELSSDRTRVAGRAYVWRNDNNRRTGFFDTNFWLQRCQAINNEPRNCVNLAETRETWDTYVRGPKLFDRAAARGYIYHMCARWTSTFGYRYQNDTGCSGFIANP